MVAAATLAGVRRMRPRDYWCDVIAERVSIRLAWRLGRTGPDAHVVLCNQADCQYAGDNRPPCPLSVVLFHDLTEPDGPADDPEAG